MTTLKSYPWTSLERGQGFFIPALDFDPTIEAGLRAAVRAKLIDARALVCIRQGQLGVLFYRLPLGRPSQG